MHFNAWLEGNASEARTAGAGIRFLVHELYSYGRTRYTSRLANAQRGHLTGRRADERDFIRPLELWRLTSKSLAVLEEFFPNGVFSYEASAEGWLEDLMLYRHIDRHSELVLGVVSHEGEGMLRVTNQEQRQLERDGFPFRLRGTYVGY